MQASSTRLATDLELLAGYKPETILNKTIAVGKIVCGTKEHPLFPDDKLVLEPSALGCSMLGNDDLFDKGFSARDLSGHGLAITIHGVTITIREKR